MHSVQIQVLMIVCSTTLIFILCNLHSFHFVLMKLLTKEFVLYARYIADGEVTSFIRMLELRDGSATNIADTVAVYSNIEPSPALYDMTCSVY